MSMSRWRKTKFIDFKQQTLAHTSSKTDNIFQSCKKAQNLIFDRHIARPINGGVNLIKKAKNKNKKALHNLATN